MPGGNPYEAPLPTAAQTNAGYAGGAFIGYDQNAVPQFAPWTGSFDAPDISGGQNYHDAYGMVPYGGSTQGFVDTRNQLIGLQRGALAQKAPSINYSGANQQLGQAAQYGQEQMGDIGAMQAQANALGKMARGGGASAARAAYGQALSGDIQGAQSAAAAGHSPMAMRNALAGMGAATTGSASGYGAQRASELQNAQQAAIQARGNIASTLTGVRGQSISAAGQAAQMAQAPASMAEAQNASNAKLSNAYVESMLGLQDQEQQTEIGQNQNDINYYLAEQGYKNQQTAQAISAGTGAASTLGSLALALA